MIYLRLFIATICLAMCATSNSQEKGIIGELKENGLPVVFRFVNEMPSEEIREKYSWLTVISWKYDGTQRNGMPSEDVNRRMVTLEHELDELENGDFCRHAYSRTGNNLKELVYYIQDRTQFMDAFNDALSDHPSFPIEINFYEDRVWEDFQKILEMFRPNE